MRDLWAQWREHPQRSQGLVEFSLIAPILIVLLFGIVDFGRLIYVYATLNQAANEGARAAVRDSPLLPTNLDVQTAVRQHAVSVSLANPCPNGPVTSTVPPANQGWIYITEPDASTLESLSDLQSVAQSQVGAGNAPGGQMWAETNGTCSATLPAFNHAPLQVTIRYNFVPVTPLIQQWTANHLVISASVTYQSEY
jgi:hypothetical protein